MACKDMGVHNGQPQFIVNGFVRSGICQALDGVTSDDDLDNLSEKMDSALDSSEIVK